MAQVICGGRLVEPELFGGRTHPAASATARSGAQPVAPRNSPPATRGGDTPVIGARPFSLITDHLALAQMHRRLLRLAVLERHGRNGNIGKGFVTGFGPLRGAIASSIGHDSHNLIVAGDADGRHGGGRQPPDRAAGRRRRGAGRPGPGRSAAARGRA